jgi:hypothetical protein
MNVEDVIDLAQVRASASSMNTFFLCQRLWLYQRMQSKGLIFGIPVDDESRRLGVNFHSAVIPQYFTDIPEKPTPKDIETVARNTFESHFDATLLSKNAETILENFIAFEKQRAKTWRQYKPDFIEKHLEFEDFEGIIDFYGDSTIIDWKTGNLTNITPDLMRQGAIYKLLATKNGLQVSKVLFVGLLTNRVITLPLLSESWIMEEKRKFFDSLAQKEFKKNINSHCQTCMFILRCWSEDRRGLWD